MLTCGLAGLVGIDERSAVSGDGVTAGAQLRDQPVRRQAPRAGRGVPGAASGRPAGISDVIADEGLETAQRAEAEQQIGCTTGTLTAAEYRTLLLANGFASIRVTATQDTEPGLRSAIIQAGDGHLCTSRTIADL